ncbi:hypothetical protein A4G19_01095 [Pasteurellaceae bacterium Macca]|nr:hypothetical protein [Pasteurellaceae bacterium Macca]
MLNEKPLISNQHGALMMAFVPFFYGAVAGTFQWAHLYLGMAWLFLYLFSYPFLALFQHKKKQKYQKWAVIYATISLLFAIPLLIQQPKIGQFALPLIPLALIQIHYAKTKNERHLFNDIAGILTFGVVGMASYYLAKGEYGWGILLHPSLFFFATTLYIKSVARERRNPRYRQASLVVHLVLMLIYGAIGAFGVSFAYGIALWRSWLIPRLNWNIKQIGLLEFAVVTVFLVGLIVDL